MATYQSHAVVDGSANNTSDSALSGYPGLDGNIYIHPGNRIPLIPKQTGKAFANFQATSKLAFDLDEVAVSSSYARGNENNAYTADGTLLSGPRSLAPAMASPTFWRTMISPNISNWPSKWTTCSICTITLRPSLRIQD